ncbi:Toxin YafO, type II toxin-antitoxin system [compost metagenome]
MYVEQGRHDHLGRDEPLHWPSSARSAALKHIHVIPVDPERNRRLFKAWRLKDPFRRTSDRMLIYVKDDKGNYCLLAYLHDNAHTLLNKASLVGHLADLAEEWFRQNGSFPMS